MDSYERDGAQALMEMRVSPTIGNRHPTVCSKDPNCTRRPLFPSGKHRGRCSKNPKNHLDNNQNEDDTTSIDESISPINTRINTRSNMRNNTNSSIPISKNSKREKNSKTKYENKLEKIEKKIEKIKNKIKINDLNKKEMKKNIAYLIFKQQKLILNCKN